MPRTFRSCLDFSQLGSDGLDPLFLHVWGVMRKRGYASSLGAWKLVMGCSMQGCVVQGMEGEYEGSPCQLTAGWWWREEWSCLGPDAGYDH